MNYPALVFWVLIVWSVTARSGTVLALLLASIPFAILALLPVTITSGMSILPQSMFAVVLILKVVAPQVLPRVLIYRGRILEYGWGLRSARSLVSRHSIQGVVTSIPASKTGRYRQVPVGWR